MTNKMMTPSTVSGNPFFVAMISAAKRGDTLASKACLYVFGHAVRDNKPLDPALARYIGDCLIEAVRTTVKLRGEKTEKRASEVTKVLGLIARRPGPRTPRFKPISNSLDVASLVMYFHQEKHPLTRNEDGAFYKAAKVLRSEPGTVEAAYLEFKKHDVFQDPEFCEELLARAKWLIKRNRKHR